MYAIILLSAASLAADPDEGFKVTQGFVVSAAPSVKPEQAADRVAEKAAKTEKDSPAKWINLPVPEAIAKAKASGKPLVVFYAQDRFPISGCVTAQADDSVQHVRVFDKDGRLKIMLIGTPSVQSIQERAKPGVSIPVRVKSGTRQYQRGQSNATRRRVMSGGGSCGPGG